MKKKWLLKNAAKLKETRISVSEDYSRRIRTVWKQLWQTVKDNRTPNEKIFLRNDKLIINSEVYTWDRRELKFLLIAKCSD